MLLRIPLVDSLAWHTYGTDWVHWMHHGTCSCIRRPASPSSPRAPASRSRLSATTHRRSSSGVASIRTGHPAAKPTLVRRESRRFHLLCGADRRLRPPGAGAERGRGRRPGRLLSATRVRCCALDGASSSVGVPSIRTAPAFAQRHRDAHQSRPGRTQLTPESCDRCSSNRARR